MSNKENNQLPKLYKNKYAISFYSEDGEDFRYLFYNVKEILKFKKIPINEKNVRDMNITIYNVLKKGKENNKCRFLTGETMRLYLVDMYDEEGE